MSWSKREKKFEKNPVRFAVKGIMILFFLLAIIGSAGFVFGIFGETASVAKKEFGASALLKKYEWFKDASATLDKKRADIKVYGQRITDLQADYKDEKRKDWPRSDREQMSIWRTELSGVKAGYNSLSAEYNAQMSKFNWSFANAGDLPAGATDPLPREYKPYEEG